MIWILSLVSCPYVRNTRIKPITSFDGKIEHRDTFNKLSEVSKLARKEDRKEGGAERHQGGMGKENILCTLYRI